MIVLVIAWSIVTSRQGAPSPVATGPGAEVAESVTTIPADVFDRVGSGGLADPLRATGLPPLRGPAGHPLVVYVGADYCPFCAAERWSLIAALSRFGAFSDLGLLTRSSSTDVFPDTPTISFRGMRYASSLVELSVVETADREGKPLATLDPVQQAAYARSDSAASIPFVSLGDRYVQVGGAYPPDVLRGKSWQDVAAAMRDPSSPIALATIGHANQITAAICRLTDGQPAAVCASRAVQAITSKQ